MEQSSSLSRKGEAPRRFRASSVKQDMKRSPLLLLPLSCTSLSKKFLVEVPALVNRPLLPNLPKQFGGESASFQELCQGAEEHRWDKAGEGERG